MKTFLSPAQGFDADALVHAMAPALGLSVTKDEIPEIALNLTRTAGFAHLLFEQPDLDRVEIAPVFFAERYGI